MDFSLMNASRIFAAGHIVTARNRPTGWPSSSGPGALIKTGGMGMGWIPQSILGA